MLQDEIISQLQVNQAEITSNMLRDLVAEARAPKSRQRIAHELEERYEQCGIPIQVRESRNPNKIDERVPNDFFSDIIDTKQGYMGNEVGIELDRTPYEDSNGNVSPAYDEHTKVLHDFQTLNDAVDQNSEMVKNAARDGAGYRLLFIPEGRNEVRVKQLPASETIVYTDGSLDEPVYAMRFWEVKDTEYSGTVANVTKRTKVEWYDSSMVYFYIDDGKGNYRVDKEPIPHLFDGVPVLRFPNNEEGQGEAEKVLKLIDAYDTIISATVSEIEQFRLAYIKMKDAGLNVDDQLVARMEQTGILPLSKDGDASFMTKDFAVDGVKIILDELRTNIYEFARSIDLSKDYGGDLRVIGWQVALLNLENSCKVTERKFKKALREQYRMICAKWKEWGVADINYLDLKFTFARNFPKDIGSEAKILLDLLGAVSRKTAYSLVSFIDDPEAELEAWDKQKETNMDLFGLGNAITGSTTESTTSNASTT